MEKNSRLRRADLASGIGAGILGLGLGLLLFEALKDHYMIFLVIGIVLHSLGMYEKQKIQNDLHYPKNWWSELLYWICWLFLLLFGIYIILKLLF